MVRILFVDDEPNILQSLRRTLRTAASDWEVRFASSGREALQRLEEQPCEVIATDLQMPGMDGAALLAEVRRRWPSTLRIITSGSCAQGQVVKAVGTAHQYLSKPYETSALKQAISCALRLRSLLDDGDLARFVSGIDRLPSLPDHYRQITAALQDDSLSLRQVGDLITEDVALSAKVLQVVNSAFFALPRRVASPGEAAVVLGVDVLRALVLASDVFSSMDPALEQVNGVRRLWRHSLEIGSAIRAGAKVLGCNRQVIDTGFLAGIMHEVGSLILLMNRPEQFERCQREVAAGRLPYEIERELFGTTHAHVAGYLLASWGLQEDLVTAVAFHHRPSESGDPALDPLCLLHLADCICGSGASDGAQGLDAAYLERLELLGRLPELQAAMAPAAPCVRPRME